jgi:hypothetical protein
MDNVQKLSNYRELYYFQSRKEEYYMYNPERNMWA